MCQIQEEIEMHRVKLCIDLIIAINYNNQLENDGRIMPTVYKSGLNWTDNISISSLATHFYTVEELHSHSNAMSDWWRIFS